jgi:hypothetical protein
VEKKKAEEKAVWLAIFIVFTQIWAERPRLKPATRMAIVGTYDLEASLGLQGALLAHVVVVVHHGQAASDRGL